MNDTLAALAQAIATVPDELSQLTHGAQTLQTTVEALETQLTEKQTALAGLMDQIAAAFHQLTDEIAAHHGAAETAIAELESDAIALQEAFETAQSELTTDLQSMQEKMTDFTEHLDQGKETVEAAHQSSQTALNQLQAGIQTGQSQIAAAQATVGQTIQQLQAGMTAAQSMATQHMETFAETIAQSESTVLSHVQMLTTQFSDVQSDLEGTITDVLEQSLQPSVDGFLRDVQQQIDGELKDSAEQAIHSFSDTVDGMCDRIASATEDASGARQLLQPLFDQLEGYISPVQSAIEAVESASFGIL